MLFIICSGLKEKINVLENDRLQLSSQLAARVQEVSSITLDITQCRETIKDLQLRISLQDQELYSAKEKIHLYEECKERIQRLELKLDEESNYRNAVCGQLFVTQGRVAELEKDISTLKCSHLEAMEGVNSQLHEAETNAKSYLERIAGLNSEIQSLHESVQHASANPQQAEQLSKVTGEVEMLRRRIKEFNDVKSVDESANAAKIKQLEEQIRQSEIVRRQLHNKIQELRGNVRVFARVRPFLPSDGVDLNTADKSKLEPTIVAKSDGTSLKIKHTAAALSDASSSTDPFSKDRAMDNEYNFSFDKVFGASADQEGIFQEVSEFVQSALDGYNVCLFSYGQTGSGKTHTMQGCGSGDMRGIIPRAMEQVGQYKRELEGKGWEYTMEVSFIEIYNESIRDLLRSTVVDDGKHEIKKDIHGNTTITDITMINIDPNNNNDIESVMSLAAKHRSVGHTAMNEQSSRSHSVFALHLKAKNAAQGISLKGTLSLVDLAGSERVDRSGVTGSRLKETVAINKSLSALTDVFVAIGNKQAHIPFRNSKLTYLLQSALSGDGKTLMVIIVCCYILTYKSNIYIDGQLITN